jgi:hypothetical protein
VLARKSGLTAPNTKDTGRKTRQMDRVSLFMLTATSMKANGSTIKLTEKERIHTLTVHITTATGLTINSTVMVWRAGPMVQNTKVTTSTEKKKAKAS